ncbi:CDP-glycerol glycerophosphotransferase family protein [Neobacillus sp. PS3-12]|uniref:CDP-glycerol glycerophosphotransferase family protein n=1 Tax=Neobacillus sp. PS3-12 TaxID=3070677 RepID=UPI0027DF91CC|nr:CDP-glycerol glycerophosphotransferase family protein [Neobacillus sp. PS3-12]WML51598.1 CDP-glycerol glycerophosphotransferase family protein [Neobacillus sp. PS3-12]
MNQVIKKYVCCAIIYIFNLLPIKKNKIFLFSYYGSQYGCNPKYITEFIVKKCPKEQFDIVWTFNDPNSKDYLTGVRKVKTMSLRYFYKLCTSKVIITNFRTTDLFIKRKDQYYIQTWHSSLRLKQIEKDAEDALPQSYVQMAQKDSIKCDLLLSGCKFSTDIFKRAFWYDGPIFEHGTPRNDFLFKIDQSQRREILKKLKISDHYKIALYAPTFRKGNNMDVYNLDYDRLLDSLNRKFGGEWRFLVKLHPHLISKSRQLLKGNHVIDATQYDDIQELLGVADFLISDYSSLMFDYAITKRPCFLYVPDLNEYISNDRELYFNVKELPFVSTYSNDDFCTKIENFNEKRYKDRLEEFLNSIGTFEDGTACVSLLNLINQICFSKKGSIVYEAV